MLHEDFHRIHCQAKENFPNYSSHDVDVQFKKLYLEAQNRLAGFSQDYLCNEFTRIYEKAKANLNLSKDSNKTKSRNALNDISINNSSALKKNNVKFIYGKRKFHQSNSSVNYGHSSNTHQYSFENRSEQNDLSPPEKNGAQGVNSFNSVNQSLIQESRTGANSLLQENFQNSESTPFSTSKHSIKRLKLELTPIKIDENSHVSLSVRKLERLEESCSQIKLAQNSCSKLQPGRRSVKKSKVQLSEEHHDQNLSATCSTSLCLASLRRSPRLKLKSLQKSKSYVHFSHD